MPKESRSRMQKWPSSTLCPPNSTVTGTTHFYPVAIRSAHVICAHALSGGQKAERAKIGRLVDQPWISAIAHVERPHDIRVPSLPQKVVVGVCFHVGIDAILIGI